MERKGCVCWRGGGGGGGECSAAEPMLTPRQLARSSHAVVARTGSDLLENGAAPKPPSEHRRGTLPWQSARATHACIKE
jgi:hypothetical protein